MPFNQKFYQEYQKKPDLYGPFWIMWTLVVILTISGNLSRYLETEDPTEFTYTFKIVPISVSLLFGLGITLPILIRIAVKLLGNSDSSVPVLTGVGIYCYSYSSFLVSALLCGFIPNNLVQWILIIYSTLTSMAFLVSTYWADLSTSLESQKRMGVIAFICFAQIGVLLVFKLYIF